MLKNLSLICFLLLSLNSHKSFAEVIHKERSLYRNILVEDNDELRCLKFNQKRKKSFQSCFYKDEPQKLVFNYTKLLFSGLLLNQAPKSVLIIGLGGGTISNTLHQLFPNIKIDNIEIDPAVVKVARQYFGFLENDQVKTYTVDGRLFVKRALIKNKEYDWVILDAFNGEYIPEHLLTKEFLSEIKQLLSPKGILTANTFSTSQLYAHESATYKAVFGDFYNVLNPNNSNRIILTSRKKISILKDLTSVNKALIPFDVNLNDVKANTFYTEKHQDWDNNTRILTDQFSPANLLK